MTATWTSSLRLEKQGTGDNSNTWGTRLDLGVIDLVDAAVAGVRAITLTGNYSLTTSNGGDEDARAAMLVFSGTAGPVNVTMPTASKMYLVYNGTNGVVTMKMASGTTIAVPSLGTRWVYSDATNVKDAHADYLTSLAAATSFQPISTFLTTIAALGTTGIDVRTNATTVVSRTLAAPAAGFTITAADGVSGNPTFALANDLAAVEALASNGIVTRTASETWTTRTITGTANEITSTNGDGVAGAPTLSLPAALTFTGKTVTGGTFASPTLSGTMTGGTVNPTTLQQASVSVGTAAFQNTGTSGANLPFLNGANTWSGVNTHSALIAMTAAAMNWASGTIASGATVNIGAAAANYLQVSGNTTITAFDTVQAGTLRILEFAGALTLTHNGTSLILPGGANVTTGAGDVAMMVSEGSGNWRCIAYTTAAAPAAAVFTKSFTSTGQTITVAGLTTVAHGLGVMPQLVQVRLKCTSADLGFSVNDEVFVPNGEGYDGTLSRGFACVPDATNLNIRWGGATNVFALLRYNNGVAGNADLTKWVAIFRAWA